MNKKKLWIRRTLNLKCAGCGIKFKGDDKNYIIFKLIASPPTLESVGIRS